MQHNKTKELKRREAIKMTALILGYGLTAGATSMALNGCSVDDSSNWKPEFFSKEEIKTVYAIAERFIPATDTPGAKELMLDRFIDFNLNLNYDPDVQSIVQKFVKDLDQLSKEKNGFNFYKLTQKEKDDLLVPILKESIENITDWKDLDDEEKSGILILRELSVLGYCCDENIMQNHFIFDPVPGEYNGCIDYAEVGGVWAL